MLKTDEAQQWCLQYRSTAASSSLLQDNRSVLRIEIQTGRRNQYSDPISASPWSTKSTCDCTSSLPLPYHPSRRPIHHLSNSNNWREPVTRYNRSCDYWTKVSIWWKQQILTSKTRRPPNAPMNHRSNMINKKKIKHHGESRSDNQGSCICIVIVHKWYVHNYMSSSIRDSCTPSKVIIINQKWKPLVVRGQEKRSKLRVKEAGFYSMEIDIYPNGKIKLYNGPKWT